ncbi:MAG: hypothetical protein OXK17_06730 [Thaumarchaeota archaeon]|nr:hypothetical protein [Nitrososphaerota archaeon]
MPLTAVKFASLLSYLPKRRWNEGNAGTNPDKLSQAHEYMIALKQNRVPPSGQYSLAQLVAKQCASSGTFSEFFSRDTVLVPVPDSKRTRSDTLWVPHVLASELKTVGLGRDIVPCLLRTVPIQKAATSASGQRPTVKEHCDSLEMRCLFMEPPCILLIDDVVTRGTAFLAAYYKIHSAYPDAEIKAFAAMRTVLFPGEDDFRDVIDPYVGTIAPNNSHAYRSGNRKAS